MRRIPLIPFKSVKRTAALLAAAAVSAAVLLACGLSAPAAAPALGTALSAAASAVATELPQSTPNPIETNTPLPSTPTVSPTPALEAACNAAPARFSPDGSWVFCDAKDANGFSAPFFASAGGKTWNVAYKQLIGIGNFYADHHVLLWTPDGHFAYMAPFPVLDHVGRQFATGFDASFGVWRLDLTSGAVKELVNPHTGQTSPDTYDSHLFSISVSPDGKLLATLEQWQPPLTLNLLSLPGGQKTALKLAFPGGAQKKYLNAGEMVWSQGGQLLAYKLVTADSMDPCGYDYSIELLNLAGMTTQTLIPGTHDPLCVGESEEYHVTQVNDAQVSLELNGTPWVYDLATKQLTQLATETPTP